MHCDPGQTPCTPDPTYDTSQFNPPNATFLALPACPYGINQILIREAGGSKASADVQCAARSPAPLAGGGGGIPTTVTGGGTSTQLDTSVTKEPK
jgi:hypothetical protein